MEEIIKDYQDIALNISLNTEQELKNILIKLVEKIGFSTTKNYKKHITYQTPIIIDINDLSPSTFYIDELWIREDNCKRVYFHNIYDCDTWHTDMLSANELIAIIKKIKL